MADTNVMRLWENIPEDQSVTVHQITCKARMDHRTIKKYLEIIREIQNGRKVVVEQVGFRVTIKKERPRSREFGSALPNLAGRDIPPKRAEGNMVIHDGP